MSRSTLVRRAATRTPRSATAARARLVLDNCENMVECESVKEAVLGGQVLAKRQFLVLQESSPGSDDWSLVGGIRRVPTSRSRAWASAIRLWIRVPGCA